MKFIYVIFASIMLYGCQAEEMRSFEYGKPIMMTDDSGCHYVIEHRFVDLYTVKPLDGCE